MDSEGMKRMHNANGRATASPQQNYHSFASRVCLAVQDVEAAEL